MPRTRSQARSPSPARPRRASPAPSEGPVRAEALACRICHETYDETGVPVCTVCLCEAPVHLACLDKWRVASRNWGVCPTCKGGYRQRLSPFTPALLWSALPTRPEAWYAGIMLFGYAGGIIWQLTVTYAIVCVWDLPSDLWTLVRLNVVIMMHTQATKNITDAAPNPKRVLVAAAKAPFLVLAVYAYMPFYLVWRAWGCVKAAGQYAAQRVRAQRTEEVQGHVVF